MKPQCQETHPRGTCDIRPTVRLEPPVGTVTEGSLVTGAKRRELRGHHARHLQTQRPCRSYIWVLEHESGKQWDSVGFWTTSFLKFYLPLKKKYHEWYGQARRAQAQLRHPLPEGLFAKCFRTFFYEGLTLILNILVRNLSNIAKLGTSCICTRHPDSPVINTWPVKFHLSPFQPPVPHLPHTLDYFEADLRYYIISSINIFIWFSKRSGFFLNIATILLVAPFWN